MKREWLVKTLALGIVISFIVISFIPLVESLSIKDNSGISLITIQVAGEQGLNNWYISDVAFVFTNESEGISSVYYKIDNIIWNEYIEPFIILDDGEHTLKWYAINYEGNTSDINGPFFFNIDQTKPTISLSYEVMGGNPQDGYDFLFTATATDDTSGMYKVEFYINNILKETITGCGPIYQWGWHWDGKIKVVPKVIGYDIAGNNDFDMIEDPSYIASLKSNTFFPDICKYNNVQSISNNVLSSEIFELENHKIIEKLPSSYTREDVFDPTYIIVVCNRKLGGNGWIVSNVSIPIFYESDRIADVFYQIYDEGWEVYTEPLIISDDGAYSFSWYVVDSEGYTSTPESTTFKIDQTPPKISIIKKRIAINQVKIIANVYDNLSNIDRVDFSIYNYVPDFTDYDFPYEWIWTVFFNQKVYVTVYDKAGNSARDSTSSQKSHSTQRSNLFYFLKKTLFNFLIMSN